MEGCRYAHALGHEFSGLLCRRALPDAESARGASADSGGEGDGGIDENASRADGGLELFEQRSLAFEGNGQHQDFRGGAGSGIFCSGDAGLISDLLFDFFGGVLRALLIARAQDDGFSCARPAQSQPRACGASASENGDGSRIRQIPAPAYLPRWNPPGDSLI